MRVQGWQRTLNEYILNAQDRYRAAGFQYGAFDCVHFAADWVFRLTGDDHLAAYRGRYSTQAEGEALLAEIDGTLLEALKKRFGAPIHPAHAQRGDIAYLDGVGCGIYFTSGARMAALFLGDGGFVMHRARDTTHAFAVR